MRQLRIGLALTSVALFAAAACTYDFHAFDPNGAVGDAAPLADGKQDESAPGDGAPGSEASDDAGNDGNAPDAHPDDGNAPDAPACVAPAGCLSEAAGCGGACADTERACEMKVGCGLSPTCLAQCRSDEDDCKKVCVGSCLACGADAGCIDLDRCRVAAAAVDGGPPKDAGAD